MLCRSKTVSTVDTLAIMLAIYFIAFCMALLLCFLFLRITMFVLDKSSGKTFIIITYVRRSPYDIWALIESREFRTT